MCVQLLLMLPDIIVLPTASGHSTYLRYTNSIINIVIIKFINYNYLQI